MIDEALKKICLECEKSMGKMQIACPYRSISNEYCYRKQSNSRNKC